MQLDEYNAEMMPKRRAWALAALEAYADKVGPGDEQGARAARYADEEYAISDLICDLMHLAESRNLHPKEVVRCGIYHWYAENNRETHSIVTVEVVPLAA